MMTKDTEDNHVPKKSFVKRLGGYAANRVMASSTQNVAKEFGKGSLRGAVEAMRPKKYDAAEFSAGTRGRYEDRGAARFLELMKANNLGEDDLIAMLKRNRLLTWTYGVSALAALIFSLYCVSVAEQSFDYFIALANFSAFLAFAGQALKCDYSAWQIKLRQFPGFRAYVDERF